MPWEVSGVARNAASVVPYLDDRPVYGGTPADASVVEAIQALQASGQDVMFYPFILMEQMAGNGLVDPWGTEPEQPVLPWRGRITTSMAPGVTGTPDGTAQATSEVEAFFGTAVAADFLRDGTRVIYTGSDGFSYRRFILHYAHLCAAAGGVDSFCIGSEMRSLTQIRGDAGEYPAVEEFVALAAEVRSILGAGTKIGYAADWSEYFGHHPQDGSNDLSFHLDDLWASADIDFIGIDNYMPVSDWRDGVDHADADWGAIYNPEYLKANIAGGEGYDWYYANDLDAEAQQRTDIVDGAYGEPWVYRYKDLVNWWSQPHHNRVGGVRQTSATAWVPGSKPIWFTEIGCAAIDKGTNQPNKFLDPKSSESALPKYSNGARDDLIQMQFLRAVAEYWDASDNNPTASLYAGRMVDTSRMFVWAWDARPYPAFPSDLAVWSDGENYSRGHWLSGRVTTRSLASVVSELCEQAGVTEYDVSELFGLVRGYRMSGDETSRSALQPLLLASGVDAIEVEGTLTFRNRSIKVQGEIGANDIVETEAPGSFSQVRDPVVDVPDRVRVNYLEADGEFTARTGESIFPDADVYGVATSELPLVLTNSEGALAAERWLSEMRVARDRVVFSLPPSTSFSVGDVVSVTAPEAQGTYRIDRLEDGEAKTVEAVRVEPGIYESVPFEEDVVSFQSSIPALPVWATVLDLPLLTGDDAEDAPWVAASGEPWPGTVAVYASGDGADWTYQLGLTDRATMGTTLNALARQKTGIWDRGSALQVKFTGGSVAGVTREALLSGRNAAAIGNPETNSWEVFQFRDAELISDDTWALSMRLRGQRGTDGMVPQSWPMGSTVVLLDDALEQVPGASTWRGVERRYRMGPARKAVDHASYVETTHTCLGMGLRPYRPVHIKSTNVGGDIAVAWVRQTRIDGDLWSDFDVPLGEASERYAVRVVKDGVTLRDATVAAPNWIYTAANQASDGVIAPYEIEIAQVSDRFGPGLYGKVTIND